MNEKDVVIFLLVQLLLVTLSIPLILQVVKPNGFYGFRTPKTLSDEKLWYRINRFAGISLLLASLLSISLFLYFFQAGYFKTLDSIFSISILPPLTVSLVSTLLYSARIERNR